MKVPLNEETFVGKQVNYQAEGPVKYYLVKTSFTCGGENFLDLDGRSFGLIGVPESHQSYSKVPRFIRI